MKLTQKCMSGSYDYYDQNWNTNTPHQVRIKLLNKNTKKYNWKNATKVIEPLRLKYN